MGACRKACSGDLDHLALGQGGERVLGADNHTDAIEGHDRGFQGNTLDTGRGNLRGFGAAARHADLRGVIRDGRDTSRRTFSGDFKGDAGVAGLIVFRERGHELGTEGIGTLDDELFGGKGAGRKRQGQKQK